MTFIGLEAYAVALAVLQSLSGVRTDEAKYLLSIPYPHPPFLRSVMSATEWVPFQEMLWRVLLASLFIHAVWLIWDMVRGLDRQQRIALCGAWLLSGSILLLSGSILLAPVNAVQALAIGDAERAAQNYRSALTSLHLSESLLSTQKQQVSALRKAFQVGETDRLSLTLAEYEFQTGALAHQDAMARVQRSIGQLEDATQSPLSTVDSAMPR